MPEHHRRAKIINNRKVVTRQNTRCGALAYFGQDAIVCVECKTGFMPVRIGVDQARVPQHSRFGFRVTFQRLECRGSVEARAIPWAWPPRYEPERVAGQLGVLRDVAWELAELVEVPKTERDTRQIREARRMRLWLMRALINLGCSVVDIAEAARLETYDVVEMTGYLPSVGW